MSVQLWEHPGLYLPLCQCNHKMCCNFFFIHEGAHEGKSAGPMKVIMWSWTGLWLFSVSQGWSKTDSRWGGGRGSTVPDARSPCPPGPVVLAEVLGKMELPRPLSLPPVARVLYLGGDVKAGQKMSLLPQFLWKMRVISLGRKESHLENSYIIRLTMVGC